MQRGFQTEDKVRPQGRILLHKKTKYKNKEKQQKGW